MITSIKHVAIQILTFKEEKSQNNKPWDFSLKLIRIKNTMGKILEELASINIITI